jgi:pimeloyl-ACP methyl ester carboxylesterase
MSEFIETLFLGSPAQRPAPKLAYDIRPGGKLALLCVHGNSSHRGLWGPLLDHLPEYAALRLDLRGHGESEWARPPAYSTADYATDIKAAAEILNGREFALVSHSNGSLASLYFATHLEPKPKALVYMDVNPRVLDEQVEYFRQRAGAVARAFPSLRDVLKGMRQVDDTVPDEAFLSFIEGGMRGSADGFRFALDPETYGSWRPADMWAAVDQISCPMLIVRAERSVVMSRQAADEMARRAPNARLREIVGAGHFLMLGKPAEVASEIRGFLEGIGL